MDWFVLSPEEGPYADVNFVDRRSVISDRSGKVLYDLTVVAPESWSQTAVDMLAQKYLVKKGVPDRLVAVPEEGVPDYLLAHVPATDADTSGRETDARQVFHRIAGTWAYWGWKLKYFDHEGEAKSFYDSVLYALSHQLLAPNSPQWFNTGRGWAYGSTGDDKGMWTVNKDDKSSAVCRVTDTYTRPAAGACYIQGLKDNLVGPEGLTDFLQREARIFSNGGGSGANYSEIRGLGEPLSGGGTSSGLLSFLKPIDASAGAIKSGGSKVGTCYL